MFCFCLTQLASVVYFMLGKQWLNQEQVLKEIPFLSNPLSQCYFFSRSRDSYGCSQPCYSFSGQVSSTTHSILGVSQEPVWVGLYHLSPLPTSWHGHLPATGPWETLSQPPPLSSPLAATTAAGLPFSRFLVAILEEGSCLPMQNMGMSS